MAKTIDKKREEPMKFQKTDYWKVPLAQIVEEEGFNVRTDYGDLEALSKSIIENGIIHPLHAYKDGNIWVLVDGHRRYRAAKLAEKAGYEMVLPIILEPRYANAEERILKMITANDGERLKPDEEAEVYRRLTGHGWSVKQIAQRTGKSQSHIQSMLQFTTMDMETKNLVATGKVKTRTVIDTMRKTKDKDKAAEIIKTAVEKHGKITKRSEVGLTKKVDISKLDTLIELVMEETEEKQEYNLQITLAMVRNYLAGQMDLQETLLKLKA